MDYSRIFGSNFPNAIISNGSKKDIDDSVVSLIAKYYDFIEKKDITSANNLYNENKAILEPYKISMSDFNSLQEELYNIGLYVLKQTNQIISETEPADMEENSTWIQLLEVVE